MNRWCLALALLVGCEPPTPTRPLPDGLSVVVRLERGGYASLFADLRGVDGTTTVRATAGVLGVSEEGVLALTERAAPGPGGATTARLTDLLSGQEVSLPFNEGLELLRLDPAGEAVVRVDGQILTLSLDRGVVPGGSREAQTSYAPGPGDGFHLRLREGRLELSRPRGPDERWIQLADGVAEIEGARWLRQGALSAEARAQVDARLKEVEAVPVSAGDAVADGDLREWRGVPARRVERSAQVLSGLEGWSGPRDASFGVSARRAGEEVVLALRVRDDAWTGGDAVDVVVGGRQVRVPLSDAGTRARGLGWEARFGDAGWQGLPLEIALDAPQAEALDLAPLVVQLVDVDPGEVPTRLGSAPNPLLASLAAEAEGHLQ